MSRNQFEFEVVVVGAGPAGLAAACVAAEAGRRVAVLDDTPWLGGQIWRGQGKSPALPQAQARRWLERFRRCGATVFDSTSAIACPQSYRLLAEHPTGPREFSWQQLVLATGARELFLPFPGWTLPGVIGPGGLQSLVKNGWPISGQRVVVAGSGPLLPAVADGIRKFGAQILSINEQAPGERIVRFGLSLWRHPGKLSQGIGLRWRLRGTPYRFGVWPVRAEPAGGTQIRSVTLTDGRRQWTEACDVLACGFHLVPNVELPLLFGCVLNGGFVQVDQFQATSVPDIFCAGEPTGIGGVDAALVEGRIAGYAIAGRRAEAAALFSARVVAHRFRAGLAEAFALRSELKHLAQDDTLICRCEDVTLGRMKRFDGWRETKLQSRCGMGSCQGRVCGAAAKVILGWNPESVRPPVLPARVESLISKIQ